MSFEEGFLQVVIKRLEIYKALGDKTFAQLKEEDFFFRPSHESNSIAVIIQHLHGNMLSRFTNFLTEDGEKTWRKRDEEFDETKASKEKMIPLWNEGWNCVFDTLKSLHAEDLSKIIYIRTEPLIVYDALLRQFAHYPHHVGQIITIARIIKDKDWQTLSIAKGESKQYNEKMSNQHLHR